MAAKEVGRLLKSAVNSALSPLGLAITRVGGHDWSDTSNFIPLESTLEQAKAAGLSVGDYVDGVMNKTPGMTQRTMDELVDHGVFEKPPRVVVEIGPGTGRYLERTLQLCRPERYEIYETAGAWSAYLVKKHGVVLRRTDGYTLSETPDGSVDLVHAHKVFSSVPFMVTCCYFHEMARVLRPGGWAVFDVMTEHCLSDSAMQTWARSGIHNGAYPAVMPNAIAVEFFTSRGFRHVGSASIPMPPGTTELMLFQREPAG